jgi:hypothetical protein
MGSRLAEQLEQTKYVRLGRFESGLFILHKQQFLASLRRFGVWISDGSFT